MEPKHPWEMDLAEFVQAWGDGELPAECDKDDQRDYYLWKSLALDLEKIKLALKIR